MTIDSELLEIMVDTITLAGVSTKDAYGKRSWASAVTIENCRVESGNHRVIDNNGDETVAVGKVYVPGQPTATIYDKLTLPDGTTPPILMIDRVGDQFGSNHTVIHYGK